MHVTVLSILAAITAVLAIRGEYSNGRSQVYLFKPLTTLLIILLALLSPTWPETPAYKWLIVAGLILCLAGDIFLMLPPRYFIAGLGSFLAGHWFYIAAFAAAGTQFTWWLLPLLIYGGVIYALLHHHLGKMRGPVVVYMLFILLMAWLALGRAAGPGTLSVPLAAVGALLFLLSDSLLALDRFRQKFRAARVLVLSTYWAAQWLIALSTYWNP